MSQKVNVVQNGRDVDNTSLGTFKPFDASEIQERDGYTRALLCGVLFWKGDSHAQIGKALATPHTVHLKTVSEVQSSATKIVAEEQGGISRASW